VYSDTSAGVSTGLPSAKMKDGTAQVASGFHSSSGNKYLVFLNTVHSQEKQQKEPRKKQSSPTPNQTTRQCPYPLLNTLYFLAGN
jgi:hypothetical protein